MLIARVSVGSITALDHDYILRSANATTTWKGVAIPQKKKKREKKKKRRKGKEEKDGSFSSVSTPIFATKY